MEDDYQGYVYYRMSITDHAASSNNNGSVVTRNHPALNTSTTTAASQKAAPRPKFKKGLDCDLVLNTKASTTDKQLELSTSPSTATTTVTEPSTMKKIQGRRYGVIVSSDDRHQKEQKGVTEKHQGRRHGVMVSPDYQRQEEQEEDLLLQQGHRLPPGFIKS
ncbi:hypothetical protein BDB00DRAFT_870137 [Zychaea mexicana]|uniref:uncharacterized protein n=1 Tax=Zychaea mexicana TaxID=64656 RepID=UPI0022FE5F27|nr:uncharacterized protein BDB00DRAFT_870137 [Zychaea mexicana]KAI9495588.1 hypothetical protein BDB00DRAFT_870137 [Zychaea mexicana]